MSTNKTIAKNTLFLYFRMFLTMGVGLYTSRLVLDALGVVDYGIYGLVGGIVSMFAFLNSSMSAATQRYLSFDIGKGDEDQLQKTFNASLNIHILIGILIVILAETIGLWFVNYKLDIPADRLSAANWVYQFSILAFFFGVIQVPYNALLIARERMNIYAYMSIVEVLLKLVIVFVLLAYQKDRLILYAILTFVVSFTIRMLYQIYCRKHFKEARYKFYYDKTYYKELLSFSGWNLFLYIAVILRLQGTNILLNIFVGPIANAAYHLTTIISGVFEGFANNFQVAVNPQITQSFAKDKTERTIELIQISTKFTFFGLLIVIVPLAFNTEYLLSIWLKEVPEYTVEFVRAALIYCLISMMSGPLITGINATGKIKKHQILSSMILLCNIIGVWFVLSRNYPTHTIYHIFSISAFLVLVLRATLLKEMLNIKWRSFLLGAFSRIFVSSIIFLIIAFYIEKYFRISTSFMNFVMKSLVLEFIIVLSIVTIGLNKKERKAIYNLISEKWKGD